VKEGTEFSSGSVKPVVKPGRSQAAHVQGDPVRQIKTDVPQLRKEDLKPEAMAFRINQIVQTLAAEIARVQGRSGPFRFDVGPLSFSGELTFEGEAEFEATARLRGSTDASGNVVPLLFELGLPEYADNAAAIAGGLSKGAVYRTSDGQLKVVY
jgi:hypothetical protein